MTAGPQCSSRTFLGVCECTMSTPGPALGFTPVLAIAQFQSETVVVVVILDAGKHRLSKPPQRPLLVGYPWFVRCERHITFGMA
jgi:hypothetical protein